MFNILGFVASTATNPIWFVKTRLQLDNQANHVSAIKCIKKIYQQSVSIYNKFLFPYFI